MNHESLTRHLFLALAGHAELDRLERGTPSRLGKSDQSLKVFDRIKLVCQVRDPQWTLALFLDVSANSHILAIHGLVSHQGPLTNTELACQPGSRAFALLSKAVVAKVRELQEQFPQVSLLSVAGLGLGGFLASVVAEQVPQVAEAYLFDADLTACSESFRAMVTATGFRYQQAGIGLQVTHLQR